MSIKIIHKKYYEYRCSKFIKIKFGNKRLEIEDRKASQKRLIAINEKCLNY